MNPTTTDPVPSLPQPPQPHRSSFSCDRHPDEKFTGFCPSCLCERLTTLDQSSSTNGNNNPSSSSSRRNSTSVAAANAATAIKSLFSKPATSCSSGTIATNPSLPPKPSKQPTSSSSTLFSELRRTKSFSASKIDAGGLGINFSTAGFEPQRKSCDVRVRNTLWSLFTLDNDSQITTKASSNAVTTSASAAAKPSSSSSQTHHQHNIVNGALVNRPVFETKEEGEEEEDYKEIENVEEIVVVQQQQQQQQPPRISCSEIVEQDIGNASTFRTLTKPMKDHIDLDSQAKKNSGGGMKEIAGSFWTAASVFSKKWHNWRRKQKVKKQRSEVNSATLPVEKPLSRQYRETQSEIADYGFGRRSCDTDPRFSLDAGRISFDDPRYSFDEPRASWDGYLIGRSFPRMHPLVENAPMVDVPRSDMQIPVEEPQMMTMNCINEDEYLPGGTAQTREYYADSSSRRRKSLDRSSSIRKTAAADVAEIDEMKVVSNGNAKVSPATVDSFHGARVLVGARVLRDSNSNSLRDDSSVIVGLGNLRDNASTAGNAERKGSKKPRRWTWNLWGFMHRRTGGNKDEDEERSSRANGVGRSFSESWQELRREGNGEAPGGLQKRVLRSNSSVSWRNSGNLGGSFGSLRKSGVEMNGHGRKRDEFVLERNRSARYSPNNDNGLLRFYLTPMRGSRRGAPGKNRLTGSNSIARSVLRLY